MRVPAYYRHVTQRIALIAIGIVLCAVTLPLSAIHASAAGTEEGFALQVSPSPLVETITPGQSSSFDLQIRNPNTKSQNLKMSLRSFTVSEASGEVKLGTGTPADIAKFVTFSDPTFTVEAGQLFTQHVTVDTPANAGFSYSFAINIGPQTPAKAQKGTSAINGSVAVFTLLSVDRPGAVRSVKLQELTVEKHLYEYLPAKIEMKFKNTGNTLVQPQGNVFIQRHEHDTTALATIPVNKAGGYLIPGSTRILTTSWSGGFPEYVTTTTADGTSTTKLSWDGGDFTKLRFGRYFAKLVAVYNDGERDVPITAEVAFWVIPWRILLGVFVVLLIVIVGVITIIRKSSKAVLRARKHKHHAAPKA